MCMDPCTVYDVYVQKGGWKAVQQTVGMWPLRGEWLWEGWCRFSALLRRLLNCLKLVQ